MKTISLLFFVLFIALPGFTAQQKKRRHTATRPAHRAAVSKPGVRTAQHPAARSAHGRARSRSARTTQTARAAKPKQTWRNSQMTPTPERYKEIQEALVAKGYGSQAPDGAWGPQWTDSLKRFQQDQKLEPSGKLTSLSLITLGLGPKREAGALAGAAEPVTRELP